MTPSEPIDATERLRELGAKPYGDHYLVLPDGRIFTTHRGLREMHPGKTFGYLRTAFSIGGKRVYRSIHKIVAEAFIPRPQGTTMVCHKDGSRDNNCATNLYWGTAKTNMADCLSHGRHRGAETARKSSAKWSGEKHGRARLTWKEVDRIRATIGAKTIAEWASELGVDRSAIWQIRADKTWRVRP